MTIRATTDVDRERWDALLDQFPSIPPLQRFAWGDVLRKSYGVSTVFLLAERADGTVRGVCPWYVTTDASGVRRAYALRYGLVAGDDATAQALLDAVSRTAAELGCASALISTGDRVAASGSGLVRRSVRLMVPSGEDTAWTSLRNKTRNMVRKAQRAGVRVRDGCAADLPAFTRVYAARMCRRGVPAHAERFFLEVLAAFPGKAELLIAEREGVLLGGMLLLTGAGCATYPFQATIPGSEVYAPTPLLTWEAVRRCAVRGISMLDMGESRAGGAVEEAKVHFGGVPGDVHYVEVLTDAPPRASLMQRYQAAIAVRAASLGMRHASMGIAAYCGVWMKRHGRIV